VEAPPPRSPDARIRFLPESDRIDLASQQALAAVAQRWSRDKAQWIVLRAQPASGGSREYAQARALHDSHEVEARLVELGVPEKRIRALAHSRRAAEPDERHVDVFLESFRPE
jgi:type IV pilus biogenesis protein CpaD/CtpE